MLPPSTWTEYVPCFRSAFSCPVSRGLIRPVRPFKPAALRLGRFVVAPRQPAQRPAVPTSGLQLALRERCLGPLDGGVGCHACLPVSPVGSMRLYPRPRSEECNVGQGSVQPVGRRWDSRG